MKVSVLINNNVEGHIKYLDGNNTKNVNTIFKKNIQISKDFSREFRFFRQNIELYLEEKLESKNCFWDLAAVCSAYVDIDERTVEIKFGSHPARSMVSTMLNRNKIEVQHGASLLYSLGEDGRVITILYPSYTDKHKMGEENIILRFSHYTCHNLLSFISKDIDTLCLYQKISDIDINENLVERIKYKILRNRKMIKPRALEYTNASGILKFEVLKFTTSTVITAIVRPIVYVVLILFLLNFGWTNLASYVGHYDNPQPSHSKSINSSK